jgi:signal transduction histidine kinase
MHRFFSSATIRLTGWYMLILTLLSLLFSGIVYNIAATELHRPVGPNDQSRVMYSYSTGTLNYFEDWQQEREREGKTRLVTSLVVFNAVVIATGGLASYYLAKRTLQPIEEALEAQTRFSSDAAHELRTPLAVMQSEIEIGLRASKTSAKVQHDLLESTLDEVGRLRSLTDRLLLLSNLKTVEIFPTSLDDVATEAINRVITLAQAKQIGIESTVGKQKAAANADVLTDTLVILLDNAIKYSSKKSTVTISAREQGKHILLEVADTGHGIDEKDIPHIFDRFYRADTSRSKSNVEGHGLGLSIAKRSVEAMGGTITVVSEVDKGTTFTIRLAAH